MVIAVFFLELHYTCKILLYSHFHYSVAPVNFPETMNTGSTKATSNGFENSLRPEEEQNKVSHFLYFSHGFKLGCAD